MNLNMICGQQTDLKLSSTIYSDITVESAPRWYSTMP